MIKHICGDEIVKTIPVLGLALAIMTSNVGNAQTHVKFDDPAIASLWQAYCTKLPRHVRSEATSATDCNQNSKPFTNALKAYKDDQRREFDKNMEVAYALLKRHTDVSRDWTAQYFIMQETFEKRRDHPPSSLTIDSGDTTTWQIEN